MSALPEAVLDDTDLVAEATAGDLAAFDRLVARHQEVAVRVATLTAGPGLAPDAVQEAFIGAETLRRRSYEWTTRWNGPAEQR